MVEAVNADHANPLFLPDIALDASIRATGVLAEIAERDLILAVVPAQHMRATLTALGPHLSAEQSVVLCAKGVEQGSLKLMTEVLAEVAPHARAAVLSGPSFAGEVARGLPTAVTLACAEPDCGEALAEALATPGFRPYWTDDLIGAEAGGAARTCWPSPPVALSKAAAWPGDAHAALVTRGFAELTRLAVALAAARTAGRALCGLGDLVLTCSSPRSRNMSLGLGLGRGESLASLLAGRRSVVEGVETAPAVRALAARLGVETPICEAMAAVLAGERGLDEAIGGLLARPLRSEAEEARERG